MRIPSLLHNDSRVSAIPETLTAQFAIFAVKELTSIDPVLHEIVARYGHPPFWSRPEGFNSLVKMILEQQISLESAKAVYMSIESHLREITPDRVLNLGKTGLGELGVTRQKQVYLLDLSERLLQGSLDLRDLSQLDDATCARKLQSVKGIGPWTASVYLLFALKRPNIWPRGDLALRQSMLENNIIADKSIGEEVLEDIANRWAPYRAVAARLLWHDYLSRRHRKSTF